MPFISSVTRRKKDAGVTLRAKVVTPKHHLSATKQYKIRIKANAMSDYDCCVADNALVVAKINNRNDLENITQALEGMDAYGNNDTKHSYSIENTFESSGKVTDYLANDGQIINRPLYGTAGEIEGFLVVKTSKNAEAVISKIPISMAPYSASEVFANSNLYNVSILWNTIRGDNDPASLNGMNNVYKNLNLANKIDFSSMCTSDGEAAITCTYDIKDDLAENNVVAEPRINNLGVISRMTYEDAAQLFITTYADKNAYNNATAQEKWIDKIEGTNDGTTSIVGDAFINKVQRITKGARIAFRVGKISIRAHFKVEGEDYYSQYLPLQIVSDYLTYEQVKNAIMNSCKLHFYHEYKGPGSGTNIDTLYELERKEGNEVSDLDPIRAIAPDATGTVKTGKMFIYKQIGTDNAISNGALTSLALSSSNDPNGFGGLSGISMSISIRDAGNLGNRYNFASNPGKFESMPGFADNTTGDDSTTQYVFLNYPKFISETNPNNNKFAILASLIISSGIYSEKGQNIGDSAMTETINLVHGFQVMAPTTSS
jgi:hypothetical protein